MFLRKLGERGGEGKYVVFVYTCDLSSPHKINVENPVSTRSFHKDCTELREEE